MWFNLFVDNIWNLNKEYIALTKNRRSLVTMKLTCLNNSGNLLLATEIIPHETKNGPKVPYFGITYSRFIFKVSLNYVEATIRIC
jgi:hypothetical protein